MSEVSFDMDAGDLSLDFANTINWHASEHPEEHLHNYSDLLAWGKAAGVLTLELVEKLSRSAHEQPDAALRAYRTAIQTREVIFRIFSDRYAGRPVSATDLEFLNALVHEATAHRLLAASDSQFQWVWNTDGVDSNLVLWEVAFAAAELLTSKEVEWVRVCEDDRGCGYLFLDLSKNHSRRWCSMESCGNRAKARRHYSRNKSE